MAKADRAGDRGVSHKQAHLERPKDKIEVHIPAFTKSPLAESQSSLGRPCSIETRSSRTASSTIEHTEDGDDDGAKDRGSDSDYEDGKTARLQSKSVQSNKFRTNKAIAAHGDEGPKGRDRPPKKFIPFDYSIRGEEEVRKLLQERDEKIWEHEEKFKEDEKVSRKEVTALKQKIKKLEEDVKAKKKKLANTQEALKGNRSDLAYFIARNKTEVTTESKLNGEFARIFPATKAFASKWAKEKLNDADVASLKRAFARVATNGYHPFATEALLRQAPTEKDMVYVVLNALLNKLLCSEIFERPFAHLDIRQGQPNRCNIEDSLNLLMEKAEEKRPMSRHGLRADILRTVDRPVVEIGKVTASSTEHPLPEERRKHCEVISPKVLASVDFLLAEISYEDQARREDEILAILEKAARLSGILSLQHPCLQYYFLSDLPETKFSFPDPWFIPHRYLKLGSDDDGSEDLKAEAKALIGLPLDLVVAPAIVRFGAINAANYADQVVICSGTSWIVKDKVSQSKKCAAPQNASDLDEEAERGCEAEVPRGSVNKRSARSSKSEPLPLNHATNAESCGEKAKDKASSCPRTELQWSNSSSTLKMNQFKPKEGVVETTEAAIRDESTPGDVVEPAATISSDRPCITSEVSSNTCIHDPDTVEATNTSTLGAPEDITVTQEQQVKRTKDNHSAMANDEGKIPRKSTTRLLPVPSKTPQKSPRKRKRMAREEKRKANTQALPEASLGTFSPAHSAAESVQVAAAAKQESSQENPSKKRKVSGDDASSQVEESTNTDRDHPKKKMKPDAVVKIRDGEDEANTITQSAAGQLSEAGNLRIHLNLLGPAA